MTTFECDGDRIERIHNYFFSPDLFVELGRELGVPVRSNGRRWWWPAGQRHQCPVGEVVAAVEREREQQG